jgi:hypothetical protein
MTPRPRRLCIIPTCHPDPANLRRLCALAAEAELSPFVVWQGGRRDDFLDARLPGKWWPDPFGKGLAIKMALWDTSTGATLDGRSALDRVWLVVDGDLTALQPDALRGALSIAEAGGWARGRFDTYGRLTPAVAALLVALGYLHALDPGRHEKAHLWTSAMQAYPAGAMTREALSAMPDGYGWDVAAAWHMHRHARDPITPIPCGPKEHRQTDRAHLARVLGEVAAALGSEAPAWSA